MTKQLLTSETRSLLQKSGFNAAHYVGHSYRIGAATTAAAAKLPSWLIKTLGRWTSDCYERYIKIPPVTLYGVSATLTSSLEKKRKKRGEGYAIRLWGMHICAFVGMKSLKCQLQPHVDSIRHIYTISI